MKKYIRRVLLFGLLVVFLGASTMDLQAAAKVKLNKTSITVPVGNSVALKMKGTSKKVTWSSAKKKIAVVSKKGKVTGKKKGKTVITAKVGGKTYKCKVKVVKKSTAVSMSSTSAATSVSGGAATGNTNTSASNPSNNSSSSNSSSNTGSSNGSGGSNTGTTTLTGSDYSYSIAGFATGTTGGGTVSTSSSSYARVTTAEELLTAIASSNIKVIEIANDIDLGWNNIGSTAQKSKYIEEHNSALIHPTLKSSGISKVKIADKNNLTIFSQNGATLKHAGITLKNCSNVIVRNLSFDELWEWDEDTKGNYDTNDWDYMTVEGCDGVWVDHCTFHQAYDGCCDSKKGTTGLSLTYCNFLSGEYNSSFIKAQFDELEKLYQAGSSSIPMYTYIRNLGISRDNIQRISSYQKKCCLIGATELESTNNNLEIYLANNTFIGARDRMVRLRGGVAVEINNIFDSTATYEADQLISDSDADKISNKGYHMSMTSQCLLSTEKGHLYASGCAILGISVPVKNNQKSASNSDYTGYVLVENSYYACGGTTFYGRSDTSGSPLAPKGANTALSWNGISLDFTYGERDVYDLMNTLPGKTGAGVLSMSTTQWMQTTY